MTQEGRMDAFDKLLRLITEKMAWVAMFAIVACMALVVTDVLRYNAIGEPIPGTHEVVELIASVILSMGIGYLTFVRGHVSVGLVVDMFRPRVQAFFDLVTGVIALGFTVWLTWGVFEMAIRNSRYGWVTGVLEIPRHPFMFLIAFSLALACVVLVRDVVRAVMVIRKGG
ncbi:MAG: TRAP transporter small permease [Desulfobacteraceae bacterium]|nr:MAG: TRAP transporter small permease [Desulfobacteraceae bacterium]